MKHATDKDFKEMIGDSVTLLDFYATWCGPCKLESEELEKLESSRNNKFDIVKVNVDEAINTAAQYEITVIPTLIAIKGDKVLKRNEGYMTAEQIKDMMAEVE